MNEKKQRKAWRNPEGSILKIKEQRRLSNGKTKEVEVIYVRQRYTDNAGRRREKKRRAESASDALTVRRQIQDEIKRELAEELEPEKPKLFSEILDYYEENYVKEAEYAGNQKVSGLREPLKYIQRHLEVFRTEFGDKLINKINYDDLKNFRENRLKIPVKTTYFEKIELTKEEKKANNYARNKKYRYEKREKTRPRALATVHRELERLRRIFNIAVRQGWLEVSPFMRGDSLISHAQENERVRILSAAEEKRLFAACTGRREHLKPILIAALDTCLRKNELFTITWKDVDLDKNVITVQALNSKTLRSRLVPITSRLNAELQKLKNNGIFTEADDRVFGMDSAKKSFYTALEKAEIKEFRFHDLRGTGITRLLRAGIPAAEVMKISGHTQWKTFMRYVKLDDDTMQRSKDALDAYLENLHKIDE